VALLEEIAYGLEDDIGEGLRAGTEDGVADVAVLLRDGGEVLVSAPEVQSELRCHAAVVLHVAGDNLRTNVLGGGGRGPRSRIVVADQFIGGVVRVIPEAAEGIAGYGGVGLCVVVELAIAIEPEAKVMRTNGLDDGVAEVVGGLGELAGSGGAQILEVDCADVVEVARRQAEGLVRIGLGFVEVPAHGVETKLVQQRRCERVVPESCMRIGETI